MNEIAPAGNPAARFAMGPAPRFSAVPLLYTMMVSLLAASVGYSISLYLSWWIALPVGIALAYSFSTLIKVAASSKGEASLGWRLTCGAAAFLVFGVTAGLSYATLYQQFIAHTSALEYFQKTSVPTLRLLEGLRSNAESAAQALQAWSQHSSTKADLEAKGGGTCPARAGSLGRRGPIAMFREAEASIAAGLYVGLDKKVGAQGARIEALSVGKPATFDQAMERTGLINQAVEASQALAHGAFVRSAIESLERQGGTTITWSNSEQFECGDTARDELIERAKAALASLEKSAPIAPLAPAIDLANPQAVAIRSLLRSFNLELKLATLGWAGQFDDDPLMAAALKKGAINNETISLLMAALLECTVVVFALLMARRGRPVLPLQPTGFLSAWQAVARDEPRASLRLLHAAGLALARTLVNLLWSYPDAVSAPTPRPQAVGAAELAPELEYPPRELAWGLALAPYLISIHDGDYICVPAGRDRRGSMAARALAFRGATELLNTQVSLDMIAKHNRAGAAQLLRLVPDARTTSWEIYRLRPFFSQALRAHLLEPMVAAGPLRGGTVGGHSDASNGRRP